MTAQLPEGSPIPKSHAELVVLGKTLILIKTPFYFLTEAERAAKRHPSVKTFQPVWCNKTGIFRECPACFGYGIFPRMDLDAPEGCGFCAVCYDHAQNGHKDAPLVSIPAEPGKRQRPRLSARRWHRWTSMK